MKTFVTILVPVYNEVGNVEPLLEALKHTFAQMGEDHYEIIFVDDGSTDDTAPCIASVEARDPRIRLIELSRNFGKEAALSAGIMHAGGDVVIMLDGDLQHPPEYIPEFIRAWKEGADVVIGVRRKNPDESVVRRFMSRSFASLMQRIAGVPTVSGATDFRLLDKAVVEEFKRFTERERITRGLIDWLGFKRAYIAFDANARHSGTARYGYAKLIRLALSAILAHSLLPLRFATYLGLPITVFAGSLGLFTILEMFVLGDPLDLAIPGTAMLAMMILFLNGILLISIGLVMLYIEKIHQESMNRPLFVVRRRDRKSLND
jgi:polyisoprenyl-phosphate glycosyltransferase